MAITTVNEKSAQVLALAKTWHVIDSLMGGTASMREAGRTYLPQQPREDDDDYKYRLETATLFPAFARTVAVMAGKPFSKQLALSEDTPSRTLELIDDIDNEGRNLQAFAADVFAEAISIGFCGILVDSTRGDVEITPERLPSEDDIKKAAIRPYWIHVRHQDILGWRTEKVGAVYRLTQLRIAETSTAPDGEFGQQTVNRVRVWTPDVWQLYEQRREGFVLIESGPNRLGVVPFVPCYGKRVGFMHGLPPLLDLAYQNIKHWQAQSDQDDSARFARKRLLVFSGLDETQNLTASSAQAIKLPVGGDAKVIQGSAESVSVGRSELDALELQMIQTGAELLSRQPGQRTATEASNDAEANKSELQRIVETFEDSLDLALQYTADWLNAGEGGKVSLFKDFAPASLSEASAQLMLSLQQGGIISKETVIRELQRRGILSPDIEPATEIALAAEDAPALGTIGGDGQ